MIRNLNLRTRGLMMRNSYLKNVWRPLKLLSYLRWTLMLLLSCLLFWY